MKLTSVRRNFPCVDHWEVCANTCNVLRQFCVCFYNACGSFPDLGFVVITWKKSPFTWTSLKSPHTPKSLFYTNPLVTMACSTVCLFSDWNKNPNSKIPCLTFCTWHNISCLVENPCRDRILYSFYICKNIRLSFQFLGDII